MRAACVQTMLPLFLRHDYWERKGNIPALTMLLQAYLRRTAPAIVAKGYLEPVLGIFAKLLAISRHYAEAYALLQAVLAHVPPADLQRYLPSIFKMLFGALTGPQKSTKNTCAFIVTVCKMACWHGAAAAAGALDAAQPNASAAILSQVMPNNLAHISGREAKRAVGIAVARFLSEHEPLLAVRTRARHCRAPGGLVCACRAWAVRVLAAAAAISHSILNWSCRLPDV